MYFKIEKSGCNVRKGLLQVRYDLFWDETDPEYALVEVPVFPPEDYAGEETERSVNSARSPLFREGAFVVR